ncbi:hypothetical protein OPV22_016240 [Ensete ventricosum]|uniref:Uncharacterized protein n=1 Tax=Ensete ventricosum TaxID=4639 RepID=A0AAV8QR43_ENSVE|nr:hypothetical protein OPV22_016240 [Ensete ventricosum]
MFTPSPSRSSYPTKCSIGQENGTRRHQPTLSAGYACGREETGQPRPATGWFADLGERNRLPVVQAFSPGVGVFGFPSPVWCWNYAGFNL